MSILYIINACGKATVCYVMTDENFIYEAFHSKQLNAVFSRNLAFATIFLQKVQHNLHIMRFTMRFHEVSLE